jgi:hypothetical protein
MHKVETGSLVHEFCSITAISNISQIKNFDYTILVQVEDTIDIWGTDDQVRGTNDLARYYMLWNEWDIDEQDLIVMYKWP